MPAILTMIEATADQLMDLRTRAKVSRDWAVPWLLGTRLHALLDCYAALGGDVSKWRNEVNVLRQVFK